MKKIIIASVIVLSITSCAKNYYRSISTPDSFGQIRREVYANADSAFMAGDASHNPWLFDPDGELTLLDTPAEYLLFGDTVSFNAKATLSASGDGPKGIFVPEETLTRKFRWFYTHFTYSAVYKQLEYDAPVPIGNYLTPEEQRLWTQGDQDAYRLLNGYEMSEVLSGVEDKFMDWYSRNCFELSLRSLGTQVSERTLDADMDKIYELLVEKDEGISPDDVCLALDEFYGTDFFSSVYRADSESIDRRFEDSVKVVELFCTCICHELVVPGRLLKTNAPEAEPNLLKWRVDFMRLLLDDFSLTAVYRTPNLWAFIASSIVLAGAIVSLLLLYKKGRV